jgi:hypothetical protein
MHFLDQATNIMANALAEHLIDHGVVRRTQNSIAELGLDHGERGLDVAPLVIVLQQLFP